MRLKVGSWTCSCHEPLVAVEIDNIVWWLFSLSINSVQPLKPCLQAGSKSCFPQSDISMMLEYGI